jgi:hypothetical protein
MSRHITISVVSWPATMKVQITEDTSKKRKCKTIHNIYRKSPKSLTQSTIGSFLSTTRNTTPSLAILVSIGD